MQLARLSAAILLAGGALLAGRLMGTHEGGTLICVFAVFISALMGGRLSGLLSLAITGVGLWFMGFPSFDVEAKGVVSSLVLWCAYLGLGIVLIKVIGHMQWERSRLQEAEEALCASEKMAATGRMAATISHELRNPIDSVMQLLYLVKQSRKLDNGERKQLELMDQELRRMAEVTQQTLAMHRQASSMVPVNVAKLIDGVLLLYGKKLRAQKIQIARRYDWQGEVPGFPAELRQVFTNLIVNAVDATPSGGSLRVHVRHYREPCGRREGVLVTLLDSGAGISKSVRRHLFQPFFTTKGAEGSGVGLWVSRGIVRRHHGSLRVHSDDRPSRSYTCFQVFLPTKQPPTLVRQDPARPEEAVVPPRPKWHPSAA